MQSNKYSGCATFQSPFITLSMYTRGLAGGCLGSANPAYEEGARARKGRETSVKLVELSPPGAPKSFPGPGRSLIVTRSRVHFCQSRPSLRDCIIRAKKKKKQKIRRTFSYVQDNQRDMRSKNLNNFRPCN